MAVFIMLVSHLRETLQFSTMTMTPKLESPSAGSASRLLAGRPTRSSYMHTYASSWDRPHLKPELEKHIKYLTDHIVTERVSFLTSQVHAPIIRLTDRFLDEHSVEVYVKREDMIDEHISGNKWRKLKYNMLHALHAGREVTLELHGGRSPSYPVHHYIWRGFLESHSSNSCDCQQV